MNEIPRGSLVRRTQKQKEESSRQNTLSSTLATTNSNITRFSKTVSATASTFVSSQYSDLSGTYYHDTMKDIVRRPAFQTRFFSFKRRAPSEVVRSTLASKEDIRYRALTTIPDELFANIPRGVNNFSLFQGFQATTGNSDNCLDSLSVGLDDLKRALPDSNPSKELKPPSRKQILKEKNKINHTLDLLEIRKGLAANEITEIDRKISHLQSTRSIVFERVATLEQEEFQLENKLRHLEMQLEQVGEGDETDSIDEASEVDPNSTKSLVNGKDKAAKNDTIRNKTTEKGKSTSIDNNKNTVLVADDTSLLTKRSEAEGVPLMSQSIFGKIEEKSQQKSKIRRHSTSLRKTMPTLQQYYSPGEVIRTIDAHEDLVTALDFDIPFGTMVSASLDDTCKIWDLSRGQCIGQLRGHHASVKCLQMDNNIVATGSTDATARLWDLSRYSMDDMDEEDACVQVYESHLREITALHFSYDTLVTGSGDKTIRQWDVQSGRCLQTLDVLWAAAQNYSNPFSEETRWRQPASYSVNDQNSAPFVGALQCFDAALASGTADGVVRLWDLRSGQVQRSLIGHTGPVTCLQFDDIHLTTGSMDRSIRIWDLRTGSIVDAFAYDHPITSLHFDARRIISTNMESTVKVYDRETGRHWTCGPGADNENESESLSIVATAMSKEGYLVEGREDGTIGVWAC